MHGRDERCIQDFDVETWGEREHLEDPDVDRSTKLNWMFKK